MGRNPSIRRAELADIREAIALADTGRPAVVIVDGDAGIGKTFLVDDAAAQAATNGALVLRSGLTEVETVLSWAGLTVLLADMDGRKLDELPDHRRHALDRIRGLTPHGAIEPEQVATALAELLSVLSHDQTVVVVLDDLQWLDRASAAAITYAIRLSTGRRIIVLATHRIGASVPVTFDRLRNVDVRRITLTGLSAAGLHHVLAERGCPVPRRSDLVRIHELSRGNPIHAIELARQLADHPGSLDLNASSVLGDASFGRLDDLDDRVIETARVCALAARPSVQMVCSVIGEDALRGLAELERRNLLSIRDGRIEFTHPIRRAASIHGMGELERRQLHRAIAAATTDPEEAVLHAAEATTDPDAELADALERAGDAAAELGVLDLASLRYLRAAELTPAEDVRAVWRRRHLAVRSAVAVGDFGDVEDEAEAVSLEATTPDEIAGSLADLVDVRTVTRGLDSAIETIRAGLGQLEESPIGRNPLYERLVRLEQHRDMRAARDAASALLASSRISGDEQLLRRAEIIDACSAVLVGEPVVPDRLVLPPDSAVDSGIDASLFLSDTLVWTNHLEQAESLLRSLETQARRRGMHRSLLRWLLSLSDTYLRWGRWDEAEQCLGEASELAAIIGLIVGDHAELAWIHAARGRSSAARDHLAANAGKMHEGFSTDRVQHAARAGFVALCEGAWVEAVEHLERAEETARALGLVDLGGLPFRHDYVEAMVHVGEIDQARRVADEVAADAQRAQLIGGEALALRCEALVANASGRVDAAAELVCRAVTAHDGPFLAFERARTQLLAGAILRRASRRTEARQHLEAAAATFDELRAEPFAARATAELNRLGTRRVESGLTASEQRVADLVASGRTNAEVASELFVSLRTVESNLTRIYRKLGLRSRTELAARMKVGA